MILYPYQRAWLCDRSRFKIGMFARQTGKTFTTTLEIADDCYDAEAKARATRWVILSRGERQAKEAIDGVKRHARAYGMLVRESDDTQYKALEIVLPHGSRVTALPANADTARGFSANVFLDEFAFHQDSHAIWRALFPVISAGFKIRVTSTPNGKNNKFHELMQSEDGLWSKHVVDIYRAVADGLPRDLQTLRAGLHDEEAWAQEFELKWLEEASHWLGLDLILAAGAEVHPYQGHPCFIGNDIGRRHDLWVGYVLEPVKGLLWTREIAVLKGASFAEQDAELDRLVARYRPRKIAIDQTGMGEKPVEDAIRRYGRHRVEGVTFTAANKLMLALLGRQAFEQGRIRIPRDDRALRDDFHGLKRLGSPPRFEAARGPDGHADRAWACFLALHAAKEARPAIEFQALGRPRMSGHLTGFTLSRSAGEGLKS